MLTYEAYLFKLHIRGAVQTFEHRCLVCGPTIADVYLYTEIDLLGGHRSRPTKRISVNSVSQLCGIVRRIILQQSQ